MTESNPNNRKSTIAAEEINQNQIYKPINPNPLIYQPPINHSVEASLNSNLHDYDDQNYDSRSQAPIIQDNQVASNHQVYKTSKQRWFILAAITTFGVLNSAASNDGVILKTVLELLDISLEKYVFIGQTFTYLSLITTIPSAYLIDRYGIRVGLYVATVCLIIKNTMRALLFEQSSFNWHHYRMIYWIIGGLFSMQTLTIFWCIPLKASETWFPANERTVSWAILNSATNFGFVSSFIYPRIIHHSKDMIKLSYVLIGSTIVTTLIVLTFVTKSKPKYPPSERTATSRSIKRENLTIYETLKRVITHKDMMIHVLHFAFYSGVVISMLAIKQDILLSSGHSKIFIGNLMSLDQLVTIVMIIILSTFVQKVKNPLIMCKLSSISKSFMFAIMAATMVYPNVHEWIILSISLVYNILHSWAAPNYNNMTAHLATGNISEATASSILITMMTIFISLNQIVFIKLIRYDSDNKRDYSMSMGYACICVIFSSTMYLLFFDGKMVERADQDLHQHESRNECDPDANLENSTNIAPTEISTDSNYQTATNSNVSTPEPHIPRLVNV